LTNTTDDGVVLAFHEDCSDVARRTLPRLALGSAGCCLVPVAFAAAGYGVDGLAAGLTLMGVAWVLVMVQRGVGVARLRLGRSVRYELHPDRFLAYRGGELATSFCFADVAAWTAARAASPFDYWLRGTWRSRWSMSQLDRYEFLLGGGAREEKVRPPALFRWRDRGGLADVTDALKQRIGKPPTV
jgi:hypothetical protein